jgi:hypothetical protein
MIDFDQAELVRLKMLTLPGEPPPYDIRVSGTKPHANVDVNLVPEASTSASEPSPEGEGNYLRLLVEDTILGLAQPDPTPYTVTVPLSRFASNQDIEALEGVEIVGATRSERLAIPLEVGPEGECLNWRAWHVRESSGPATLFVRGECRFPSAGYSVELRPRVPQGFNPADLLLERIVHEPSGSAADVITTIAVEYQEKTDFEYETLTILPINVTVAVQKVDRFTFLEMVMRRIL